MLLDTAQEIVVVLILTATSGYLWLALLANWKLREQVKYWRNEALGKGLDK